MWIFLFTSTEPRLSGVSHVRTCVSEKHRDANDIQRAVCFKPVGPLLTGTVQDLTLRVPYDCVLICVWSHKKTHWPHSWTCMNLIPHHVESRTLYIVTAAGSPGFYSTIPHHSCVRSAKVVSTGFQTPTLTHTVHTHALKTSVKTDSILLHSDTMTWTFFLFQVDEAKT